MPPSVTVVTVARFRARFTGTIQGSIHRDDSGLDSQGSRVRFMARFTGFPGSMWGRLEEAGRSAVGKGRGVVARCAVRGRWW